MPLVCDATALVALGGIGLIGLLKDVDREVVLSPWVKERELRKFSDQIELGIEQGWLRVLEPSATEVRNLIAAVSGSFDLDQGEAETIVVAGQLAGRPTRLVIDEGEAFVFIQRALIGRGAARNWAVVCLADLLHEFAARGSIDSAADTMQQLLDAGHYRWSSPVWAHYVHRCNQHGTIPLPRSPREGG